MRRYLLSTICMLLAACPGALEDPEAYLSNDCQILTPNLLSRRCTAGGCHNTADAAGELDLASDSPGSRYLDAAATDPTCPGTLIDPADPEGSIMYTKSNAGACGNRMPLFDEPLTGPQLDCMLEWIAAQ